MDNKSMMVEAIASKHNIVCDPVKTARQITWGIACALRNQPLDSDTADDYFSEAIAHLIIAADKYDVDNGTSFATWCYHVAHNYAKGHFRGENNLQYDTQTDMVSRTGDDEEKTIQIRSDEQSPEETTARNHISRYLETASEDVRTMLENVLAISKYIPSVDEIEIIIETIEGMTDEEQQTVLLIATDGSKETRQLLADYYAGNKDQQSRKRESDTYQGGDRRHVAVVLHRAIKMIRDNLPR